MNSAGHECKFAMQSVDVVVCTRQAERAAYTTAEVVGFVKPVVASSAEKAANFNETITTCHTNETRYCLEDDAVVICRSAGEERVNYNGMRES